MPEANDRILESTSAKVCVIAAPGNGKTSGILIPKTKKLLGNGIDPRQILLLTFSRLSALDLRGRVKTLAIQSPRAATVHSYCLSFLLSENNHDIRTRVESILLDFEKDVLLSDLKLVFPTVHKKALRKLLIRFSAGWAISPHDQVFEGTEQEQQFKHAVLDWLVEHEAAMMEEIVFGAVDLVRKIGHAPLIDDPRYILVDEYQDLNRVEQEFVEFLAANSDLLLVVGDPDQSIYSFKFAHPEGIVEFADRKDVDDHYSLITRRCPRRVVELANQLLRQASPGRTELLQALPGAAEGEVHLVVCGTQLEEFERITTSISTQLHAGVSPKDIIVLVPRKKLGSEFVKYFAENGARLGVPADRSCKLVLKPDFGDREQEAILRFGLLVKPNSVVHARAHAGLGDSTHFAAELRELKNKYRGLRAALASANPGDAVGRKGKRVRQLCERISGLREFLAAHHGQPQSVDDVLDEIFPVADEHLKEIRSMLDALKEDGDSVSDLYGKFLDEIKNTQANENTVRVMTLIASKGLEAPHVYIIGCNAGNIPGAHRKDGADRRRHVQEQRRLLYVGVTRAKISLTISWSRHIPFEDAKGQQTAGIGTRRIGGRLYTQVGICEFLQDTVGFTWEQ
jgi:superfamily I DNA/RNA helicase